MNDVAADPDLDLIAKSIVEIRKLNKELAQLKAKQKEPIAIVGIGCEFPGDVTTPDDYWQLLCSNEDAMGAPPSDRWRLTNPKGIDYLDEGFNGGYLNRDVTQFDPLFFNIPPKEAKYLDPQHRVFMENTWNALKSANIDPESLNGSKTGLFCGITGTEYLTLMLNEIPSEELSGYMTSGNCLNFIAGRLSYILGIQGPSLAIDTACSSSLVALHYAVSSLRSGECDMAIAGGVSLMLTPQLTLLLQNANMLAADGRCKTFDDSADGYARGEGCGVVILKRLSDAIENSDKILSVIKNTNINHDGKKSGLTVPRSESQKKLIIETASGVGVPTEDVIYSEAHGTGTSLGDPIELEALNAVYAKNRSKDNPLYIGSAKSKIGHLEAAAGIAGLIKTVLSIHKGKLPPHLNCVNPNRHFDWESNAIKIVDREMVWPKNKKRIASVSSFGASGTNAHVILEGLDSILGDNKFEDHKPEDSCLDATYEFERSLCWYTSIELPERHKAEHKVTFIPNENISYPKNIPLSQQKATYEFTLNVHAAPHILQHRIFGRVVLTGSVYLEVALQLGKNAFGENHLNSFKFSNVTLLKPIAFPTDNIRLKVVIENVANGDLPSVYRIRMYPGDAEQCSFDDMYSSIDLQKIANEKHDDSRVSIEQLIHQFDECYTKNEFYTRFWGHAFTIGEKFQIYDKVWRIDGHKALGYCQPLNFLEKTSGYGLDPENIIAYLSGLLFKGTLAEENIIALDRANKTYIGTGYEACYFYESLQKEAIYCYTEITYRSDDDTQFKGFAKIYDEAGNLLCWMEDIGFAEIDDGSVPGVIEDNIKRGKVPQRSVAAHPILGKRYSNISDWQYDLEVDYFTYPLINDHLTFDIAIFPAVGYIDLALKAIRKIQPDFVFTQIDKLQVATPLIVNNKSTFKVRAGVEKTSNNNYYYNNYSLTDNDEWMLNATTDISGQSMIPDSEKKFDKKIVDNFDVVYSTKDFFDKYWSNEFFLGETYHFLEKIWSSKTQVVGVCTRESTPKINLGLAEIPENFQQIYMALPAAVALVPDERIQWARNNDATTIAVQIGRFVVYENNGLASYTELWSHCILREQDEEDVWISDFDFFDDKGKYVARVEGVEFRIMHKKSVLLIQKSTDTVDAPVSNISDSKEFITSHLERIIGVELDQLKPETHIGTFMDSIMALELRGEIEKNMSVLLPFSCILESQSIDDIVRHIDQRKK